jgi:AraC family transcriptional regulator of adaptative response/methylated-DNA-[protein]-cysteine methyltransferase
MTAALKPPKHADLIAAACRTLKGPGDAPPLAELAAAARMSPFHFQRIFKQLTGVTPKAFAAAHRAEQVRYHLQNSATVTQAIYDAGFNSNGRFYENSTAILGMAPETFRTGGKGEMIHFAVGQCSLGAILVASSAIGVCSILMGDDPEALTRELQDRFPHAEIIGADERYEALIAEVVGFVDRPALGCSLPLDLRGTAFQRRVWQALREIPPGEVTTYAAIAQKMGCPKSVRAVAAACAANAIAVAIPCHRVIRKDGTLSGYRWGVERKQQLLDLEARDSEPSWFRPPAIDAID